MTILAATGVGHAFGADDIFSDISVELAQRDRVGLVGPNGVGKTTLLLILAGLLEPTLGIVQRARDLTLGYLRQEAVLTFAGRDHSVYEEMLTVFASLREQEGQLRQMEEAMAAGDLSEALFEGYGRLQEQYEHGGGYEYQIEIKRVLLGLGFDQSQWETPLAHLSGGQKTRLLLGRLLLEKPGLLILDEPTNHLDMAAVEWLEATLRNWPGALLIVSHDRYFLDRVVNQVWEMSQNYIRSYRGNYTAYVQQRQALWEREMRLFEAEKSRLESELEYIQRHMAGGQGDMARGKLKRLTRDILLMEQAQAGASLHELQNKSWLEIGGRVRSLSANEAGQRLRALRAPSERPPQLNIRLETEQRSGRIVLRAKKLQIGYPGVRLFSADKLKLERRDCVALIGPNGSGKTTFLRILMGQIPALAGELQFGEEVRIGYFAQAHDQLTLTKRVIDELLAQSDMSEAEGRHYLAQYLFRGDDVFKQVSALSGGERGRLALALLALGGANFLLLDEPTNHLDIPSQEVLQEVLESFDGTILLVSHDRYLINRLATQIWELRDGHLHVFEGTYEEFLAARDLELGEAELALAAAAATPAPPPPPPDLDWVQEIAPPPSRKKRKGAPRDGRRLQAVQEQLEDAEVWLAHVSAQLKAARAAGDERRLQELEIEYTEAQMELEVLTAERDEIGG